MKLFIQAPDPNVVDVEELIARQREIDARKAELEAASWKSFWGGLADDKRAMLVAAIRDSGQYDMQLRRD